MPGGLKRYQKAETLHFITFSCFRRLPLLEAIEAAETIEVIRSIHRNPVARGLVTKPELWPWSSFRHYASGAKGRVAIESQWTAFLRGNRLPEGVCLREGERSCFPTQAAKNAAWMGHKPSREN